MLFAFIHLYYLYMSNPIKLGTKIILVGVSFGMFVVPAKAQKQIQEVAGVIKGAENLSATVIPQMPSLGRFVAPVTPPLLPQANANVAASVQRTVTVQISERMKLPPADKVSAPAACSGKVAVPTIPTIFPSEFLKKQFVTGPQALEVYMPAWRSELLPYFNLEQLDILERTFQETDEFLFKLDENGNWLAPATNSSAWEYGSWFSLKLKENLKTITDGQWKVLFGKFSRFNNVFTRLDLQAFMLVNKRMPKATAAGEEGQLARNMRHMVTRENIPLRVAGFAPENFSIVLRTPVPNYGVRKKTPNRTPEEVLAQVEEFMATHHRFPMKTADDATEVSLRKAFDKACAKAEAQNLADGTSRKLLALKAQWVKEIAPTRTPKEVLAQVEEFIDTHQRFPMKPAEDAAEVSLRQAFDSVCIKIEAQNLTDDTSLRLLDLKAQWVRPRAPVKTPEEVLTQVEEFVATHQRMPLVSSMDKGEASLRQAFDTVCKKIKAQKLTDDTSLRLLDLKAQWVRARAPVRTPEEVLTQVEEFVATQQRMPALKSKDAEEVALRKAFDNACRKVEGHHLTDDTSLRLLDIKAQWVKSNK